MSDPITVIVSAPPAPIVVTVPVAPAPIVVTVTSGPQGEPGLPGTPGQPGTNAATVVLTLAEYLALPLETQMDGRWYIIPKTI